MCRQVSARESKWCDLYPHLPGHISHSSPKGRAGSSFLASLRGQSVGRSHYFRGQQWSMRRRREVFPRLSCDSVLTSPKNIPEQLGPESYIFKWAQVWIRSRVTFTRCCSWVSESGAADGICSWSICSWNSEINLEKVPRSPSWEPHRTCLREESHLYFFLLEAASPFWGCRGRKAWSGGRKLLRT